MQKLQRIRSMNQMHLIFNGYSNFREITKQTVTHVMKFTNSLSNMCLRIRFHEKSNKKLDNKH